jgi:hypothetical protein
MASDSGSLTKPQFPPQTHLAVGGRRTSERCYLEMSARKGSRQPTPLLRAPHQLAQLLGQQIKRLRVHAVDVEVTPPVGHNESGSPQHR